MYGRKRLLCLLVMVEIIIPIGAQQIPMNSQDMEDLLYRDESAIIHEPYLAVNPASLLLPLNLNTASEDELEASDMFTPYQIYQLLNYRKKYGPLYSIYELDALPGFQSTQVSRIESRIITGYSRIPENKKPRRHMILVNLERSRMDSPDRENYAGSDLKSCIRIRSDPLSCLSLALTYEKDAGEPFLYRNRPQFLSGYLTYKGKNLIRQLLFGNYRLNHGAGLVNGSGFIHRAGNFRITRRSISMIKPHASVSESNYEQGLACILGKKRLQCMLWASYHHFSLSPTAIAEHPQTSQWFELQRSSGLFRTESELEARDLAYRFHTGIQLLYKQQGLSMGVMSGSEWTGPGSRAKKFLAEKPVPGMQHKISLHGNWYKRKIQVFGELSASEFSSLAFLAGTNYQFNDFINGSLLIHHYGAAYQGSLPSSYASGSKIRNEQGLAFHLRMETGETLTMHFTGELFRFPSPRYLTQGPSGGYRLDLSLQNPLNNKLQWRTRLVCKIWQTTPADEITAIRPLLDSRLIRIDGQLIYNHNDRFRWLSRLVIGHYQQGQNPSTSYATVQQVAFTGDRFKALAQFVLFCVSDWANRIYLYEPGLYYSFRFPAYYGSGQKSSFLFTCKVVKGFSVSAKISWTIKNGKKEWDSGIQLQTKL